MKRSTIGFIALLIGFSSLIILFITLWCLERRSNKIKGDLLRERDMNEQEKLVPRPREINIHDVLLEARDFKMPENLDEGIAGANQLIKKLMEHPEALKALRILINAFKSKGENLDLNEAIPTVLGLIKERAKGSEGVELMQNLVKLMPLLMEQNAPTERVAQPKNPSENPGLWDWLKKVFS